VTTQPNDAVTDTEPHPVATGKAASTPVVAIGATFVIIAVAFFVALGLAGLAYWLAG
jgi:hypothetical protein